ncbi:MAG: alpha/beta fold hydrolase [Bacteroidia bacterium]|nr:alpha/beta fold hydrolase [Bacteroidia bacterium]
MPHNYSNMNVVEKNGFKYVEEGKGPVLLILHGLFGALSNFQSVFKAFKEQFRVVIPLLPIYEESYADPSVSGLTKYIEDFVNMMGMKKLNLLGNSLGGHIALVFSLRNPALVETMTLTGSSGLFESGMGSSFPKRGSYEYVKERVQFTFYDPATASKELVDEVFEIISSNFKTLRILKIARSAQQHNMRDQISAIKAKTLLVWGLNDNITPPRVAHEFNSLFPSSKLRFIDKCGHAAMMEQPTVFNRILKQFFDI